KLLDVALRGRHPYGREAERGVDRNKLAVFPDREGELVLEGDLQPKSALGQASDLLLEKGPLANRSRLAVEPDMVGNQRGRRVRVGKLAIGVEVGNEPHFADRPHAVDRLQLVERVHRLHPDGEPDPAFESPFEPVPAARLGSDRAVISNPQKADEADSAGFHLTDDVVDLQGDRLARSPGPASGRYA